MIFIYNALVVIAQAILPLIASFSAKIKLFVTGRKAVFKQLEASISSTDNVIWIHTASLGEFEQGLPVIEVLKKEYPTYKILITFFSPSGYEVKKHSSAGDIITYLPLDTQKNAQRFIATVQPKLALFVKYEIWPNYMKVLKNAQIPTLLFSAYFKPNQAFFKWYGGLLRKTLHQFNHIFVQDDASKKRLAGINYTNVTVGGDTRFDRVSQLLNRDNELDFMTHFSTELPTIIAGSTWTEDETLLIEYANTAITPHKMVLAPHTIDSQHITEIKNALTVPVALFSSATEAELKKAKVLIVDTIGILTKIYSYATLGYVGGGFKTGLHNVLEPAVFNIPVCIGPNYKNFKEATDLVALGGVIPVHNLTELKDTFDTLLNNLAQAKRLGAINSNYIRANKGGTLKITQFIEQNIL